jgi:hypothetical protein
MRYSRPRSARALAAVTALSAIPLLSGCGTFDSSGGGEKLVRDYIKKAEAKSGHKFTVKSVHCPSVKEHKGGAFDCSLTVFDATVNRTGTGTVTLHMLGGGKVEINGPQDVHVQ